MNYDFSTSDINTFANYLRREAEGFYSPDNQPLPSVIAKLDLQFAKVEDGIPHVNTANRNKVSNWLLQNDVTEWAPYRGRGTAHAIVVRHRRGRLAIGRIPASFSDSFNHARIDHAAEAQPLRDANNHPIVFPYRDKSRIELLPFFKTVGLLADKDASRTNPFVKAAWPILTEMYATAGLRFRGIKDDLGVLPGGAPLPVDPDNLEFDADALLPGKNKLSTKQIVQLNAQLLREIPEIAPLFWMAPNGMSKQEIFFPPGYLAEPAAPAANLKPEKPYNPRNG